MKVKLLFETEIEDTDCPTQYDILHMAVQNLDYKLEHANSNDDLADIFKKMTVNGSCKHPGFGGNKKRDQDSSL